MPAALKNREQIVQSVCERLANGEPLTQICRDKDMPCVRTVWDWANADSDVSAAIARAREAGFDAIAQDAFDIADQATPDDINVAKLRVETRLKLLAKWDPKRYGDRQVIDMSVSQTISIRDALAQAERRVIDVVAKPVLSAPESFDDTES